MAHYKTPPPTVITSRRTMRNNKLIELLKELNDLIKRLRDRSSS